MSAFSGERVRYLIVGGYAVGVHGHPRATKDLDLWVEPTRANARRVLDALRRFGAPLHGLTEAQLTDPELVFQIGLPPNRVDILSSIRASSFAECYRRRLDVAFVGIRSAVIGLADLIANKIATGRLQDLADAEALSVIRDRR